MYNNDDDSDPDWEQFSEEVVGGGLHTNPLPEVVSLPPAAATAAADGLQQQGAQEAKEDEGGWHDRYCGMHGSGDEEGEDEEEGEEATATPATAARSPGSMAITPIPTEPMEEGSGSGGGSSSDTESGCETVGFGSDEAEGSSDDGMSQDEEGAVGGVAFEEVDTDSLLDMLHTAAYNGKWTTMIQYFHCAGSVNLPLFTPIPHLRRIAAAHRGRRGTAAPAGVEPTGGAQGARPDRDGRAEWQHPAPHGGGRGAG